MLGDSSRDVTVRLRAEVASYITSMRAAGAETKKAAREAESMNTSAGRLGGGIDRLSGRLQVLERDASGVGPAFAGLEDDSRRVGREVDQLSGRLAIARDALVTLGPAATPVAGVMVPALTGLASQAGFAALAGGTLAAAFQGVGGALKAMNKAQLEPTAANLQAARVAMAEIHPEAQAFVVRIRELIPALKDVRDEAAEGLFGGGLTASLDDIESLLPKAQRIVGAVAGELGSIAEDSAASLASDRWADFFVFLETEGPQSLRQLSDALGNTGHAVSELWEAFDPLNDDFGDWLVNATARLDDAASGLQGSQGLADFFSYIETTGPQVGATFGAIGNAVVQLVQATAPLGGPVLSIIEKLADGFASLADSNLGTPLLIAAAGMATLSRATQLWETVSTKAMQRNADGAQTFVGRATGRYAEQVRAVGQLPDVYRKAASAQTALVTAQRDADRTTGKYLGTLQAANLASARGVPRSAATQQLLATSLGKVEAANFAVTRATEKARDAEARRTATTRSAAAGVGKTAAGIGALTVATSGMADGMGLSNTATLGLAGAMAGPLGAAAGATVGFLLDTRKAAEGYTTAIDDAREASSKSDFSGLTQGLKDFKRESSDIRNVTGVKDFFSDFGKQIGTTFTKGRAGTAAEDRAEIAKYETQLRDMGLTYRQLSAELGRPLPIGAGLGQIDAVAQSVEPALRRLGLSVEDLADMDSSQLSAVSAQIAKIMAASDTTAGRTDALGDAIGGLDDQMLSTADSASAMAGALGALIAPSLSAEEATDAWRTSLQGLREELDNSAGFKGFGEGAVKNRAATREYMATVTNMLTKEAEAGASSGKIANRVNQAREAFIREGVAAGKSAGEMRRRAREIGLTPKLVATVFKAAGIDPVAAQAKRLARTLDGIPKSKLTRILADGIPKTQAGMRALQQRYNLTPKQVRTLAQLRDLTPPVYRRVMAALRTLDRTNARATASMQDSANPVINAIRGNLRSLDGDSATIRINTLRTTTFSVGGRQAIADGGTVQGPREPYGDKVLTYLAPGEEVITNRNGQADRFRADRAAGRIPAYADGGTTRGPAGGGTAGPYVTLGPGLQVVFPTPAVVAASVVAAEKVAVSAARTARSYRDQQDATLTQLQAQQRVTDLERSLAERGSKRVRGRDGVDDDKRKKGLQDRYKYVGYSKLTGIARDVAQAELVVAKRELEDLRGIRAEIDALTERRTASTTTLTGLGDIFGRGAGAGSAVASVNRAIGDITAYGQTIARLKAAGASKPLLQQIIAKAESGDLRSANRLGQALLAQPALLGQLNTSLGTLGQVAGNVATLTTDPRLMATAAWNPAPTVVRQSELNVNLHADPSTWTTQIMTHVRHYMNAQVAQIVG